MEVGSYEVPSLVHVSLSWLPLFGRQEYPFLAPQNTPNNYILGVSRVLLEIPFLSLFTGTSQMSSAWVVLLAATIIPGTRW